ncbi:MAG: MCE family protein [Actinomycetota bacterium]|jgi:phospholipid/cholesterol/gamma-HCH transport system substrate-binding protein|nr:MCE family protein [Actinomycetota bacterium]
MRAFTERSPKTIGAVILAVMAVVILAVIFLNRSVFSSGYTVTARFPDAAGVSKGTQVLVAGVPVGSVQSVTIDGNAVDVTMSIDHGVVLPRHTAAAIKVETLLGVVDLTLDPESGWSSPLKTGAVLTDTSVPTEFYQLQNTAGKLLQQTNAQALNGVIESLAAITQGKQQQVEQIIQGLGKLTTTISDRSGAVSQLIDSANTLSTALASRDSQLASVIDQLNTVVTGLASHSTDLASLIDNIDAAATQTNSLVGQEKPQLDQLLTHLHTTLGVVGQHQDDLAQAVSYLSAAVKGFASVGYSGPQDTPNSWANIYDNLVTSAGAYGVLAPCGALDQALDEILGPTPLACNEQTGPLPGSTPSNLSPSPATDPTASPGTSGTSSASGTSPAAGGPSSVASNAPDSGLSGLSELLSPLAGGVK